MSTTMSETATQPLEHASKRRSKNKVRYAVVGLGYIAQIAVLPAFEHARGNSKLAAFVSGDPEKLRTLAGQYGVENTYSYEQYVDCLESGQIDAVYIALPNHMHRAYTTAAAEKGIHVLCEKPLALSEADCEAMIAVAEEERVKLMTAYRLHFDRANLQAIEIVNSGEIGEPRMFTSTFSQQVRPGNSRLKRDVTGGPLHDMGIYCINAARYLFKAEPVEAFAWNVRSKDERFVEVPETTSGMLGFPEDRVAFFTASFGAAERSVYEVVGTKGSLKLDPAYEMAEPLKMELTVGDRTTKTIFKKHDQFAAELVYFSDCILQNKELEPSGYEGLADVRIIEALLKSADTHVPVSISPVDIKQRPDTTQEISRPPVSKEPELVRAAAPGAY
jgi:predicted dehydrogenase